MLDLAFLAFLLLWSIGVGRAWLRGLGALPSDQVEAQGLAIGLGLGTLSLATFALGLVGWMTTAGIMALLGLGLIAVAWSWRVDRLGLSSWWGIGKRGEDRGCSGEAPHSAAVRPLSPKGRGILPSPLSPWERVGMRVSSSQVCQPSEQSVPSCHWLDLGFGLALGGVLLGTLLVASLPVTDGDALCYHLQVPKVFLENQGLVYKPDLHETVYPLVVELLYAVGLAIRGPIACRLIQWLFGVLLALSVAGLARPILGARAWWASTIALAVPAVSNGMAAPMNDVALAAYCNLALLGGLRWLDQPSASNAGITGVLAGLAIGVKYPALVWVAVLAIFLAVGAVGQLLAMRREGKGAGPGLGDWLKQGAWFSAGLLLVGGVWPWRCYGYTGNPVFPFFRDVFGSGLDVVLDPIKRPLPTSFGNLLTALVPMTLQPDRFDSLAHQFGPVFLMALPGIIFFRPKNRILFPLLLAYAFLTLCMTQRQSMRFLLAAIGPFSMAVAWMVEGWSRRSRAGIAMAGLVALLVMAESGLALTRVRQGWEFLLGWESAAQYLDRREPTWRVGRWIDQNLPPEARLIGQDHRGFYLPRPYTMELAHRRRTGLASRGESDQEVVATLRSRGFTHLILCPPIPEDAVEFDPTLSRRLSAWTARQSPIFEETIADADGVRRAYAIYQLEAPR